MTRHTFNKLVQLNNDFYQTVAQEFSNSRKASWSGWDHIVPTLNQYLQKSGHIRILDIGCGNGRFGSFLLSHLDFSQFTYFGVDNSSSLLSSAQHVLSERSNASFIQSDFILKGLVNGISPQIGASEFDIIVCFGVFHHIPSHAARQQFIFELESLLTNQGSCCLSCWQFTNSSNLMKRQVHPAKISIDDSDLEPGDYILDWQRGKPAHRYCHLTTQSEITTLIANTRLEQTGFWIADGKNRNLNHYYLFEKKAQ